VVPPVFSLIQKLGNVPDEDMRQTFNMGIGLIIIVQEDKADSLFDFIKRYGKKPHFIGNVV
jgi:phosphoribosylformylglycinamidine cyclo-ligase